MIRTLFLTLLCALLPRAASSAPGLFVIEAEDFNHGSGQHVDSASQMPYLGGAYNGLSATANVDYAQPADDQSSPEYRIGENPNVPMTQNGDMVRGSWTMTTNYRIGWTSDGDWYNYTRNFPAGQYKVSAAISHSGTTPGELKGTFQRITAGANTTSQTIQQLGTFDAPGSGGWGLNNLVPLKDAGGNVVALSLNGLATFRFTAESGDIDYYLFEPLLPPQISQQPQSLTVVEGTHAHFQVVNGTTDPVSYQWQSNQVNMPGFITSGFTLLYTRINLNGTKLRCLLSNSQGTATSSEATLTVTRDTTRPTLTSVHNLGTTTVDVKFSEWIALDAASTLGNYSINGGISVQAIKVDSDSGRVFLTVSPLTLGNTYTLTVNNITDGASIPNAIAANSQLSFIAQSYAPLNIGGNGNTVPAEGGINVTGGGGEIGNSSDKFHFAYEKRTNNFDIRVRLANLTIPDAFAQAGLMVREALDYHDRFAGVFASSAQLGAFFESRGTASAATTTAAPLGGYPANYPQMWLRLQRSGNNFTGFASFDGEVWTQLGTASIALPSVVYFGMAVASGTAEATATAQFRDLGEAIGGSTGPLVYNRERLGPSSRRTGLAISEIMYHPKARPDLKNLEFIELYNGGSIFEDLSGFRLSGAVEYAFPAGTLLPAGAFLVVAKSPADLQSVYGITGVFGPYTNSLENGSSIVRLREERDRLLLEAHYSDGRAWPSAADGAGHSLVLARPSFGEADVRAWEASTYAGGSPGNVDPVSTSPEQNILINEILAHTDDPQVDFIELYNHSNASIDLSGFWLSDDPATNKFRIPNSTSIPARGFLAFNQNALGFSLSAAGETVFLVNAAQTRVLDAVKFSPQENGVSSGRWPDGASQWRRLAALTPNAANSAWRGSSVVINEIMYNPISGNSDEEYIELHNSGAQAVNLQDWTLEGGVDFRFPAGASIPGGGYVVVAKNAAQLRANYPNLTTANTFGDYSGTLKNSSEKIELAKPDLIVSTNQAGLNVTNRIQIVVHETAYGDGGRWSPWADGGGSSLELTDPRADATQPDNWRESDESSKGQWSTVEFTGTLDNGNGSYPADQLQITLQGAGECLVDQVEVLKTGVNYITQNANFESGATGWVFQGNHSGSSVVSSGAVEGTRALHLRAPGRGDTGLNRIRAALNTGLASGNTATIRAKVRWIKGWPEILLRLRGNWLECAGTMSLPKNLGTPGAANSRRVANAGPAIYAVTHSPVLPASNQAVLVTARVSDPEPVNTLNLRFRIDPNATLTTIAMKDDGTGGDAVAGDGLYTASISGRAAGTLVAFRVEAADANGATHVFPADTPAREALIRWGESLPFGTIASYRMLMPKSISDAWNAVDGKDNTYRDMTFIYNNDRVIYNAGTKDKGSPFHGGGGDAFLIVPEDEPFLGGTSMALCSTGNGGNEDTQQREQIAYWIGRKIGSHYLNRRFVNFFFNGSRFNGRNIMEDAEEPNGDYASFAVPDAADGDLYKIEDWFEFDDAASGFGHVDATLQKFTTAGGGYKTARYRWAWRKRAVENSANDYTNIFNLVTAVNTTGANYVPQVENLVNVRGWMSTFALQRIAGNWDSYGMSRGKNSYIYKGEGLKWEIFPWDIDFVLGSGSNGATDGLWGAGDPVINTMYDTPAFQRLLWQAYLEAVTGPMLAANYNPQIDGRYRVLLANGITGVNSPAAIKTYIDARRNHILGQLNAADAASFAITSNNGNNFSTNKPIATISGTAPFSIYAIEINGVVYPVTWSTPKNWTAAIPLPASSNPLTLVGVNRFGQPVAGSSDTITVTYTGAISKPEDFLVINEIMYNAALPGASFIELFNRSTTSSFDLSGWRLDGVGYVFHEGSILAPNTYLVLVQDPASFAAVYGANILIFGQFPGTLDNGGERLELVKPGATPAEDTIIDQMKYDDDLPWPVAADGFGPSLQLIDASKDNWPPANWGTTASNAANRATPRAVNSISGGLAAFDSLYLNEVLPQNVSGSGDRFGEKEPWIELINSGSVSIDLSGYYLSDTYTNLTKWQFPAGTTLAPGRFLIIWADNEPGETTVSELHANFRLAASSGSVALVRVQATGPAVVDYINYNLLSAGRSHGSYPDGQPQRRQIFHFPTLAAANNPASAPISVFINEWMAGNSATLADPADGHFEDWIELFNAGASTVDLSAYTLTDTLTNISKFTIPAGKTIPPGGYLIIWADEETGQNATGADVHANFKLGLSGEDIGLFAPDGTAVDTLTFGAQTTDVSEGRASDGIEPPFVKFTPPTPRAANYVASANQPPVLAAIGNKSATEGLALTFRATATDPDAGQSVAFSLAADAPAGASIDPASGDFAWTPSEAQGPGSFSFTIRVADNGAPSRSDTERITVDVLEANRPPVIEAIANATVNEGSPLGIQPVAADPDLPANTLAFSLDAGAPTGASIDPATGAISWTPSEAQGGVDYPFSVRVTDGGAPPLSHSRAFSVRVNEVNNPPILQAILPQTIDEGQTFTVTAQAADPDNPPANISYTLDGSVPQGAAINPVTGVLTWPTSEATGPSTNIFTVRATENTAEELSDARSFSVIIREVNQAPILTPISDLTVTDGTPISLTVQARDNDVPSQTLAFSLGAGAPAGAAIDSTTGAFAWSVPLDHPASTNTISVTVTDNGPGNLSATGSFKVIVRPSIHIVFSEVLHSPSAANAQFIELHNNSAANSWNISGWRVSGKGGLGFTFPIGTILAPGAYLNIAKNRAAFQAAPGATPAVLGDWSGDLQPAGDTLLLIQPGTPDVVIDKLTFGNAAPWPAASGGAALQLVDAQQDNNRVANWEAATDYNGPTNLVAFTSNWRFNQSGADLGAGWRSPAYNDSAWSQGGGVLYVENAALPEPKTTLLTIGPSTFYFRTRFTLPQKPQGAQLQLRLLIDDGAIIYLNGQELYRIGMDAGAAAYAAFANRNIPDAAYEGPFIVPGDALVAGENVLAVEVHQVNAGSSDIVMGLALNLLGGQIPGATPGQANSVAAALPAFDPLFVNEVLAVNSTGLQDSAGDRDPWVELHNSGTKPVLLNGLYLTDNYSNLARWAFPAGASISPGEYKIIWLDGEPGESLGNELHASFRLASGGSVALVRQQNGEPAVIDYLAATPAADLSNGASPNGQVDDRLAMVPTPGTANTASQPNRAPQIAVIANQKVAEGALLQFTVAATDPDAGQTVALSLLNPPAGAALSPAGVFTWTPAEAQAPSTNIIVVVAEDNGVPALRATNSFQIVAAEVNAAPALAPVGDRSTDEGQLLVFNVSAIDADSPAQSLAFSLINPPAGAAVSPAGEFTWTPSEAQGPGTNIITLVVTDSGDPGLTATNQFKIVVADVNSAPSLAAISDQSVAVGGTISVTPVATDADLPAQSFRYTLEGGILVGASIHTTSGLFTFSPESAQANTTNLVTIRVTDNGSPALSASHSFRVIVQPAPTQQPQINTSAFVQGRFVVAWSTQNGVKYRIQYKDGLGAGTWQILADATGNGRAMSFSDPNPSTKNCRFYRIAVLP